MILLKIQNCSFLRQLNVICERGFQLKSHHTIQYVGDLSSSTKS